MEEVAPVDDVGGAGEPMLYRDMYGEGTGAKDRGERRSGFMYGFGVGGMILRGSVG